MRTDRLPIEGAKRHQTSELKRPLLRSLADIKMPRLTSLLCEPRQLIGD